MLVVDASKKAWLADGNIISAWIAGSREDDDVDRMKQCGDVLQTGATKARPAAKPQSTITENLDVQYSLLATMPSKIVNLAISIDAENS